MKLKVNKFTTSVAGATIILVFASILIRIIGFLREIVYANEFGLSKSFDVYLVASIIPITTNTIIYFIGQNFFIPLYSQLSQDNNFSSYKFLKNSFASFVLFGLLLGTIYLIFAYNIVLKFINTPIATDDISVSVFRIFSLTVPISSLISIISAYLNKEKLFLPPILSTLFLNILVISFVMLFNDKIGVLSIAYGYLVGSILQLLYLFKISKFKKMIFTGTNKLKWKSKELINSSLIMIIVIESIGQLYLISDRFFFSSVREGSISALNYAQTLLGLPISILILPLSTVIFPKLSEDVYKTNPEEILANFKDTVTVTVIIFIPVFYMFNSFGENIISILLQRGKFSNEDTITTAHALRYLNIGLLFYAVYSIFNKLLYSAKLIKQLLLITVIGIFVKIFFNYLLVNKYDYIGLAISTSLSYLFFFGLSLFFIGRRYSFKWFYKVLLEFALLIINGLISLLLTKTLISIFTCSSKYCFLLSISFFTIIYFFNLLIIKSNALNIIINHLPLLNKFNRF